MTGHGLWRSQKYRARSRLPLVQMERRKGMGSTLEERNLESVPTVKTNGIKVILAGKPCSGRTSLPALKGNTGAADRQEISMRAHQYRSVPRGKQLTASSHTASLVGCRRSSPSRSARGQRAWVSSGSTGKLKKIFFFLLEKLDERKKWRGCLHRRDSGEVHEGREAVARRPCHLHRKKAR
eukprot:1740666-Rhodomonas_salina.3